MNAQVSILPLDHFVKNPNMKITTFRYFLTILVLVGITQITKAQKFGYVNSAEILSEMPEVKQADANLEALQKQLQKKGQGMLEKLQQDYQALQQQAADGRLSPLQQEQEAKKLQERQAEIAKFEQDMVNQLQEKRAELLQPILDRVNDAIKEVGEEYGLEYVFDYSSGIMLYATDRLNMNQQVKAKL